MMWEYKSKQRRNVSNRSNENKQAKMHLLVVRSDEEQKFLFPILTPLMHDLNGKIMK